MKSDQIILGIDIGTTKVAACVIDTDGDLLAVYSKPHQAWINSPPGRSQQDVNALLDVVSSVVIGLPKELRAQVKAIGITGQMHGVTILDKDTHPLTPLITWQDSRCLENDFLSDLNARTGVSLCTGFGCATIAWLIANGSLPASAKNASTIHDLLAAKLTGVNKPLTDTTDAASFGLFDLQSLNWDFNALKATDIPAELLPRVVSPGAKAGSVCKQMAQQLNIPAGVPVAAAIGDNQASLLATLKDPEHELALTLGTGGQLSAVLPPGGGLKPLEPDSKYEYRPFPGSRFLVTASCLCGGSAWNWLVQTVENWLEGCGLTPPPKDQLYDRLNRLGLKAADTFVVHPHFLGERYDTSLKASIAGLNLNNFDLGTLSRSLAKGIIENLKSMLPEFALRGRTNIVASGNALRQNPLLQAMAEQVFGLPLNISDLKEEAACGAALNAAHLIP